MDLDTRMTLVFVLLIVYVLCSKPHNSTAADIISSGETLSGMETITSKNGNFVMGFFTPGQSRYHIGIWYNYDRVSVETVVWVANRDKPLRSDSASSELKLLENGNLVLYEWSRRTPIWSTNLASNTLNYTPEVFLGDDGNLVLRDKSNPTVVIWQSFDYPTHTWLPGAKIGFNKKTNETKLLTSWVTPYDSDTGIFSLGLDPTGINQYVAKWNKSVAYWTSGKWNERAEKFTLAPEMGSNDVFNFSYISNENESYFTYNLYNSSILARLVMDVSGQLQQFTWSDTTEKWNFLWSQPKKLCDVYRICGPFGNCNQDTSECECLPGYETYQSVCLRSTFSQCGSNDGFSPISTSKLPDHPKSRQVNNMEECKSACQSTCSCNAYAYGNSGCQFWEGDILNTKQQSDGRAGNLYLRVPNRTT
ncbi:hypothetical protein MKX03_033549, partial [Papaver bracteatum]